MRKIIQYIRSLFFEHEWEKLDNVAVYDLYDKDIPLYNIERWRCKKCGYIQRERVINTKKGD